MSILMYDTTTPAAIGRLASTSLEAVAGYGDGKYRDIAELRQLYPNHRHLEIVVDAGDDGDCLDVENGDALISQAPGWLRRQHARGAARPWLYCDASSWPSLDLELQHAGIPRLAFVRWVADWNGIGTLAPNQDAHQFANGWHGHSVDTSVLSDEAYATLVPAVVRRPPAPPVKPPKRPIPIPKPSPPVAAGLGVAITGAIIALLHVLGEVQVTAWEASLAGVLGAWIASRLAPAAG